MVTAIATFQNVILGRETYEVTSKNYTQGNFDDLKARLKIIVSNRDDFSAPPGFVLARNPEDALRIAASNGITTALLVGGGRLANAFLRAGLISDI